LVENGTVTSFVVFYMPALDVSNERIYFYNNNDNAIESVTFAGEHFTKVVTQGKYFNDCCTAYTC